MKKLSILLSLILCLCSVGCNKTADGTTESAIEMVTEPTTDQTEPSTEAPAEHVTEPDGIGETSEETTSDEGIENYRKEARYILSDELNRIDKMYVDIKSSEITELSNYDRWEGMAECRDAWKKLVEDYTAVIIASEEMFTSPYMDGSEFIAVFRENCVSWEAYAENNIATHEKFYNAVYTTGTIVPILCIEVECEIYRDRALELYMMCRDNYIDVEKSPEG